VSAPTHPSSNPRDLSTLIALLRSSNQGLCLDAANEIDRLLRDNVDLMKACTARMYSTHEPSVDVRFERGCYALMEIMKAYERRIRSDCTTQEQLDKRPWECAEYIAASDYLKKVWPPYSATRVAEPPSSEWEIPMGPQEMLGQCGHWYAVGSSCPTCSVSPPREGYSQAYADQMRTALLRIAGWREIDRNSLGERLREIEEIALAALMPTVTKGAGQ
jgi:hypothetical protein